MIREHRSRNRYATVFEFDEPYLEFGGGQVMEHPRHGLGLFGPYDSGLASRPSIGYAVLGTSSGIEKFGAWAVEMNRATSTAPNENNRLWIPFPGFEACYGQMFPQTPIWSYEIDKDSISIAVRYADPHERAFGVVELYLDGLRRAQKLDEHVGAAICVVPEEVWRNCRPLSRVSDTEGLALSNKVKLQLKAGQLNMFEDYNTDQFWHSTDFRRQLKARSMRYSIPIQLIRESTLCLGALESGRGRDLSPLSDRKWNLSTALYYKCGGKPWRLVTARDGVCYIGISFRRADDRQTACCAAQMFLNSGDGIVFLGEYGPWYSPKTKQFALSRDAAARLLNGVLRTYEDLEGKPLTEVFLHKRSYIDSDEFAGFREGCPPNVRLVGVRVRSVGRRGVRLYRKGNMPVVRGTFWKLNRRSGLLWGSGYKREIGTYDGSEVPRPIRIDIQYGDAEIERVAQDVLGLTKLNYNACRIGDSQPVTIGFSDKVGEILISHPRVNERKHNFKYYI